MSLDAAEALSEPLGVAVFAARADLGAAANRIPGCVGPLDFGKQGHQRIQPWRTIWRFAVPNVVTLSDRGDVAFLNREQDRRWRLPPSLLTASGSIQMVGQYVSTHFTTDDGLPAVSWAVSCSPRPGSGSLREGKIPPFGRRFLRHRSLPIRCGCFLGCQAMSPSKFLRVRVGRPLA